jgi:hypothetical protein
MKPLFAIAGPVTMFLAKVFGKKIVFREEEHSPTGYLWRGDFYVTRFK